MTKEKEITRQRELERQRENALSKVRWSSADHWNCSFDFPSGESDRNVIKRNGRKLQKTSGQIF